MLEETRTWWRERTDELKPLGKRAVVEILVDKITVWPWWEEAVDEDESEEPALVDVEIKGHIPASIGNTSKVQGKRA